MCAFIDRPQNFHEASNSGCTLLLMQSIHEEEAIAFQILQHCFDAFIKRGWGAPVDLMKLSERLEVPQSCIENSASALIVEGLAKFRPHLGPPNLLTCTADCLKEAGELGIADPDQFDLFLQYCEARLDAEIRRGMSRQRLMISDLKLSSGEIPDRSLAKIVLGIPPDVFRFLVS